MICENINTAPKDGTVILTDCGCVRWLPERRMIGYQPTKARWIACSPCGTEFECADNGYFTEAPKLWTPLPTWMN